MKKRTRKITIDNKEDYAWAVFDYNCDGDGSCRLKIYKNKLTVYEELVKCNITPSIISQKIKDLKL